VVRHRERQELLEAVAAASDLVWSGSIPTRRRSTGSAASSIRPIGTAAESHCRWANRTRTWRRPTWPIDRGRTILAATVLRKPQQLARLYESLRPYGGKLVILTDGSGDCRLDGPKIGIVAAAGSNRP
jgi:hypothetical protein